MKMMQIQDAVDRKRQIRCIAPNATLVEAWRALQASGLRDLVVTTGGTQDGTVIGVLSDRALMDRGLRATSTGLAFDEGATVAEALVRGAAPATEDMDLASALGAMRELQVTALPLVQNGRLAGLVTETDILQAVARRLLHATGAARINEQIVEDVETTLANPVWTSFMQILGEAGI